VIKTQKRIDAICGFVHSTVIADIGTDHGYVPQKLFRDGKINFAYATDISDKCLDKARVNLKDYSSRTKFLCGDGLKVLLDDNLAQKNANLVPKQIIIAGIGAREIKRILAQDSDKVFKNFVLQPQKNVVELRIFLSKNKFKIVKDVLVKDGKMFYNIIVAERSDSTQKLSKMDKLFGKTNIACPTQDFVDYVNFEKDKCQKILHIKSVPSVETKLLLLNKIEFGGKNV
jgi:tRNA A22 N-methylase